MKQFVERYFSCCFLTVVVAGSCSYYYFHTSSKLWYPKPHYYIVWVWRLNGFLLRSIFLVHFITHLPICFSLFFCFIDFQWSKPLKNLWSPKCNLRISFAVSIKMTLEKWFRLKLSRISTKNLTLLTLYCRYLYAIVYKILSRFIINCFEQ